MQFELTIEEIKKTPTCIGYGPKKFLGFTLSDCRRQHKCKNAKVIRRKIHCDGVFPIEEEPKQKTISITGEEE